MNVQAAIQRATKKYKVEHVIHGDVQPVRVYGKPITSWRTTDYGVAQFHFENGAVDLLNEDEIEGYDVNDPLVLLAQVIRVLADAHERADKRAIYGEQYDLGKAAGISEVIHAMPNDITQAVYEYEPS